MATQIEKAAEEYARRHFNWSHEQEASAKSYIAGASEQSEIDREVMEKSLKALEKAKDELTMYCHTYPSEILVAIADLKSVLK